MKVDCSPVATLVNASWRELYPSASGQAALEHACWTAPDDPSGLSS